jgi:uncharacterized protein (DUF58 family)
MFSFRRFFWRSRFFPRKISFSREGKVFVLISLGLGFAAINTGNNLIYLVFSLSLAMIVLSGILSEWNLRKLRPFFSPVTRAEAMKECFVEVGAESERKRLPAFSVQVRLLFEEDDVYVRPMRVLEVRAGQRVNGSCVLKFSKRGVFNLFGVAITTDFPFSFFSKSVVFPASGKVLVHPRIKDDISSVVGYLPDGEEVSISSRSGRGTEIFGLRDFRVGDNPRHKVYKRILPDGKELVKEFEQEGTRAVLLVVFDIYDDKLVGRDVLEKALEDAASVCVNLVRQGVQVGVKTVSGRVELPAGKGEAQLFEILDLFSTLDFLKVQSSHVEEALSGSTFSTDRETTLLFIHPALGVTRI